MNIYRLDDDAPKSVPLDFDPAKEFSALEFDSEKREEMIREAFGNYIVTLGKKSEMTEKKNFFSSIKIQKATVSPIENVRKKTDDSLFFSSVDYR